MKHIIIGDGPAGEKAAEVIRNQKPNDEITIITEEQNAFYLRPGLVNYLSGELKEHELCTKPISKYQERNIAILLNTRITKVNPQKQEITIIKLEPDGQEQQLRYDQLLIATGANYFLPTQLQPYRQYIHTMYTIADANQLIAASKTSKNAVVMGSSLLGAELVRAFHVLGKKVTYLTGKDTFWPRTLFHTQAEQIAAVLRSHGIEIIYGEDIRNLTFQDGKPVGVTTSKRREFSCDLVGIATDLVPTIDFLKESGIKIFRGVVVDTHFRTNIPNIFAAGDVAQVYYAKHKMHQVHYSWINAAEQGEIAGWNMAGVQRPFHEEYASDELEMYGMNVLSRWIHKE